VICLVFANASVLIPLARIGKLALLQKCFKEVKITQGIREELTAFDKPGAAEIGQALLSWIKEEKTGELKEAKQLAFKENISEADAALILCAKANEEEVLTNDYRLHAVAKTKAVETVWLTTLLLKCAKEKILTKKEAKETLLELVQAGMRLKVEVYTAIEKKIGEI